MATSEYLNFELNANVKCDLHASQFAKKNHQVKNIELFHDGGLYHRKTSQLICRENQWTGVYITRTSIMKELSSIYSFYHKKLYQNNLPQIWSY